MIRSVIPDTDTWSNYDIDKIIITISIIICARVSVKFGKKFAANEPNDYNVNNMQLSNWY